MQNINNSWLAHAYETPSMPLVTESHGVNAMDVKSQLHSIETEAYGAVLRAFIAQSDVLSWGKEGLITELRRELNVTDHEHRKLLAEIDSDESVRMIRELRRGIPHSQDSLPNRMNPPGVFPGSLGNASRKILKTSHAAVSELQRYVSQSQPTSAAIASPLTAQFRDGQCTGELPLCSTENARHSMKVVIRHTQVPSVSNHRGPVKSQSKKRFCRGDVGNFKKRSDVIEIHATEKVMREVESIFYRRENPDPHQVEKAKSILRDQERAILEALSKLADMSDGDDSPNQFQHYYSHEELPRIRQRITTHNSFYGQV